MSQAVFLVVLNPVSGGPDYYNVRVERRYHSMDRIVVCIALTQEDAEKYITEKIKKIKVSEGKWVNRESPDDGVFFCIQRVDTNVGLPASDFAKICLNA